MRFLHISDLHLGKQLCGFSLREEQAFMLQGIVAAAENEGADAVLIAGDIYDKSAPSSDAMSLFSDFLSELSKKDIPVYIISGNHDSAQRISYFSDIIKGSGIYVSEKFEGTLQQHTVEDAFGKLHIHLLPFIKPVNVRGFFPEEEPETYADAVAAVLHHSAIDPSERNVLICHQFITGSQKSGSEAMSVGGLENIPSSLFDAFDYVAMGHIHGAQKAGRDEVRYCGSPMKYDASEAGQTKALTFVDVKEKGNVSIFTVPLPHMRDLIKVEGEFDELMKREKCEDFAAVVMTNEDTVIDAAIRLRQVYPKMISFGVKNARTNGTKEFSVDMQTENANKTPMDLFVDFFQYMNGGNQPTQEQMKLMIQIFDEAESEEN